MCRHVAVIGSGPPAHEFRANDRECPRLGPETGGCFQNRTKSVPSSRAEGGRIDPCVGRESLSEFTDTFLLCEESWRYGKSRFELSFLIL